MNWLRASAVVALLSGAAGFAELGQSVPSTAIQLWMQESLNNWQSVCEKQLHLEPEPLPWIIFYDDRLAWHVNPDETLLPASRPAGCTLKYNGRRYDVIAIDEHAGKVWLPDRNPIPAREARIFTSPYASGGTSVVVCALPGLVERTLEGFHGPDLADFLLGIVAHEMTHTRQAIAVDARFKHLAARGPLPTSFDDNVVESTFGQNKEFRTLFEKERDKLLKAALQDDEPENGRKLVREALALMRERRAKFFVGEHANYGELEDIFLMMEGIGQWVHFQVLREKAPAGEPWQKTAQIFLGRTQSWVQWEGFALFVLINREIPNWQARFFSPAFPSPFTLLE
jgi:hypothetical protein